MATREEIEAEEYAALLKPDIVLRAPRVPVREEREVAAVESDVQEAMEALDAALDSKEIALAMRKVVAKRLLKMVGENKVGAGDLVKLLGMTSDRVDGKVADKVEHSGNVTIASIMAEIRAEGRGLPVIGGKVYDMRDEERDGVVPKALDVEEIEL